MVQSWRETAAHDQLRFHGLTDDPATADLILFVDLHLCPDWKLRTLREHPLVRDYRQKVLVYNERDDPWCILPGLYCSMPASHFDDRVQRACAYYKGVSFDTAVNVETEPDLLFSFLGSYSHPIRRKIFKLDHPRAVVENTAGFLFYDRSDAAAYDRQKAHYQTILFRSKFVVCPRGAGAASIRLFETMAAGRVPVIISDQWVPPQGLDWEACSIRVRESDIASIPRILEASETRYPQMSAAVRAAHEAWFAPKVIFHRMIEACVELLSAQAPALRPRRNLRYYHLSAQHLQQKTRSTLGRWSRKLGLRPSRVDLR